MTKDSFIWFEDCHVGQKFHGGPVSISAEDIIAFAKQYDPQVFHTDPVGAKDTSFGQLTASGWHTAALTMRMVVAAVPEMKGGMIGRGVEKMSWPRPVLPGDTLSYEAEILELRRSASNPARGIVRLKNTTRNQHGDIVMDMESVIFIPVRNPTAVS